MKTSKLKVMMTSISLLTATTFVMVVSVFAWFSFDNNNIASIVVTTGSLEINDLSATAYKYEYPTFTSPSTSSSSSSQSGEIYYDYDSPGTIETTDLLAKSLIMNKYDPFYIKLNSDINVADLMTNVVVDFQFTIKSYSDFDVTLKAERKNSTTTLGSSKYMDFWSSTKEETDFSSLTSVTYYTKKGSTPEAGGPYTAAKDKLFYGMKNIEEGLEPADGETALSPAPTKYTFIGDDSSLSFNLFNSGKVDFVKTSTTAGDDYMEKTYNIYVNFDYNQASLESYADSMTVDQSIKLNMDYYFSIEANQHAE